MKRILLMTLGLITIIGGGLYYYDSQIPRATAILQVHPLTVPSVPVRGYMESEFETPASEETLAIAAKTLELSPGDAARLHQKVKATPMVNTDFIQITVKDKDSVQAAKIANAIAEAYVQKRAQAADDRAKKVIEVLDNELAEQNQRVQENLAHLRAEIEISQIEFENNDLSRPKPAKLPDEGIRIAHLSIAQSRFKQAMEHYEQSQDMLREIKMKQEEYRVLLRLPQKPVTIFERAK